MNSADEHIEIDAFDREYNLEDLLPRIQAQELLEYIDGSNEAALLLPDGTVYYSRYGTKIDASEIYRQVRTNGREGRLTVVLGNRRMMLFPLNHELETIGFLALEFSGKVTDETTESTGCFLVRVFNRIVNLNYQIRMTAGLHGQVVADSYEALKKKAALLERSEEKYRILAESLEKEVKRKTKKIEATQLMMLQQEKMAAIGQLAAGMAHEINNPVGFVISNLNTLKTGTQNMCRLIDAYHELATLLGKKPDRLDGRLAALKNLREELDIEFVISDTAGLIDESLDGARRIQIIVQNLRDFAHPSVEYAENADINACLETTLAILSGYRSDEIVVQRHYGDVPQVNCQLREINQAFFNILKNAFQAIGDRGRITISTRVEEGTVIVAIADTGSGIEKKILGRIFDPFFTTREVGSGFGLGLFQAYSTLKRHQGTISVQSAPGKGTTFTLWLPTGVGERALIDSNSSSPNGGISGPGR
jgi:two-component system, NtrC family, sensor kinase